ncbi:MAG: hypothetical protein ACLQIB_05060 [Isosphaeraceae bacterium]
MTRVINKSNPLAWWAVGRFEAQSEFICDRDSAADDPAAFAQTLLRLSSRRHAEIAIVQVARSGSLFERIHRLLAGSPRPAAWKCALPVAIGVLVLGMSAVRFQLAGAPALRQGDATIATVARPPLPRRALLQIGTDDLRTRREISDIAFSPDGRLVAAATGGNSAHAIVTLFDVATGKQHKQINVPPKIGGGASHIAFSPDGSKLLWGDHNGWVSLWDLTTERMLFSEKIHGGGGVVNGVLEDAIAYLGPVNDVAFSPDGSMIASVSADGAVQLRQVAKPTEVARDFKTPRTASGRRAGRMGGMGGGRRGGPDVKPGHESANCVAFTPDGALLIVGSGSAGPASISVWRIRDGQLLRRIEKVHGDRQGATSGSISSLAVTPDGRLIMSAGESTVPRELTKLKEGFLKVTLTEVRFWDVETGRCVKDLTGDEDYGFGAAVLSPDAHVWDVDTGKLRRSIRHLHGPECFMGLSPNGKTLAISDRLYVGEHGEDTIRLYDLETGNQVLALEPRDDRAVVLAFSPDGTKLFSGFHRGSAMVWDVRPGERPSATKK